jgi:hypothetical protein
MIRAICGFFLVGTAMFLCPPTHNEALARSCAIQPVVEVIYPAEGEALRKNSVILLFSRSRRHVVATRGSRARVEPLSLVDARGNKVPAEVLRDDSSTLLRLVPKRRLVKGRRYAVQYRGRQIRSFRVARGKVSRRRPALGKARVEVSGVITGHRRRKGRNAWVLGEASKETAAVESHVVFGVPAPGDEPTLFVHRRGAKLQVASISPCSRHSSAPVNGAYVIRLTPWSRAGRRGRTVVLKGSVEREATRPPPNQTRTEVTVSMRIGVGGGMIFVGSLIVVVAPNVLPIDITFSVTKQIVPVLKLDAQLRPEIYRPFGAVYTIKRDPVMKPAPPIHLVFSYDPKEVPAGFKPENLAVLNYSEGIPPYPGHPTTVQPRVADIDTTRQTARISCSNGRGSTYQLLAVVSRPEIKGNVIVWPSAR